jgi:hypothetical protein
MAELSRRGGGTHGLVSKPRGNQIDVQLAKTGWYLWFQELCQALSVSGEGHHIKMENGCQAWQTGG